MTGRICNIDLFSTELEVDQDFSIVDKAIAYNYPYILEMYILIVRNALYIPDMSYNLLPPFILREGVLVVKDVPKIQFIHSTKDDY